MNLLSDPGHQASHADGWQLRTKTLALGPTPRWMGIVNITPDSFSDGGRYFDTGAAVDHALQLVADGADILDIGGESTRPGSAAVDAQEELRRVLPVVEAVCRQTSVPVSIDTTKAVVARECLGAGAEIINDITALTGDPAMELVVVQSGCAVCLMHMRGEPATMQRQPEYVDVVAEVLAYLRERRDAVVAAGVAPSRIALDPGIGFGKTLDHNLRLLASAGRFHELGSPLLYGPSRKRFIGELIGDPAADRTGGTIGVALALAQQGVQIIRLHDIAPVRQAHLLCTAASGGRGASEGVSATERSYPPFFWRS
jgi:dihydropteroate synthase